MPYLKYLPSDIFFWFHAHVALNVVLLAAEDAERNE